jgi:DNA polymerase elongation subunit (family B)
MKIKKITKELNSISTDHNIYIDTDSIFFSAVPLLNHRYTGWEHHDQNTIAGYVNEIAAEMQDYLNNFYDILGKRVFNVSNHRFQIKKEFVSKAGIWIAKKRYAQWIISDNGVPVDRLDVKGLDVVRSSYPIAFRKFMNDTLIDILGGVGEAELTDKVHKFKKSLHAVDVVKVAKGGGVKQLSKYIPKKRDKRAMFQFNSGTPAHVKAAIAYNQLLVHFGVDTQYEALKDGDKIKWVYLKQNPFGLDGLAMNGYNDPPQIMELITSYIDTDKIFEREMLKKLEDFYGALNWGEVLSGQKTAEQFFSF